MMSDDLSEHHLENVGERETHRVDPDHVDRFRDPERVESLRPGALVEILNLQEGDHVLEVGCGDGLFFDFLSEEVGPTGLVTGVDIEPAMVETARDYADHAELENVWVKVSENDSIPLDDQSVDHVLLVNVLHEMAYPTDTLKELARVLKPGGRVLLHDRYKEETGPEGPPIHHLISESEARELFEANGFQNPRDVEWDPNMYTLLFKRSS